MGTTNYFNTLIEIAADCPVKAEEVPPVKEDKKSVANLQFEMLFDNPYRFTSDDVLFAVFATRKEVPEDEMEEKRQQFFSQGQPCFRASPLTKRYGWGIHSNEEGKIAMYGSDTETYRKLVADESVKKRKAMSTKRS